MFRVVGVQGVLRNEEGEAEMMNKLLSVFCLSLPLIGIFGVIAMSEGILVVCGIAGFVVVSLGLILFGIRLWGDL